MIYNKAVVAAFLLAFATTSCEAEYTRHSRTVRGSSMDDETNRLLYPASGKGKGGSKSKKGFSFTNPKKGKEECIKQTTYLIEGSTTAIPSATNLLPAGFSFKDCNDLLSVTCRAAPDTLQQVLCLSEPPADLTNDLSPFYKCLETKGVIDGPWFFHPDTPGSQFRFGKVNNRGGACSKITSAPTPPIFVTPFGPKAEIQFSSEEFYETKLADFVSFEVDYSVVSQRTAGGTATNEYFVNIYVRTDPTGTAFYDCNFIYKPDDTAPTAPPATAWKTLSITLDTPIDSQRDRDPNNPGSSNNLDPACTTYPTLRDFLNGNRDAVIGVGSAGSTETINLVVGETSGTYTGLEVCWDNVQVTTRTEKFVYDFEPAA